MSGRATIPAAAICSLTAHRASAVMLRLDLTISMIAPVTHFSSVTVMVEFSGWIVQLFETPGTVEKRPRLSVVKWRAAYPIRTYISTVSHLLCQEK
jgi:hypothetical protein